MTDDPRIDQYFETEERWKAELAALRAILLSCPLEEEWKWRSPVYTAHGGNVAIVWGFKDRATLGFFKGVLLKDPEGILELPGQNSRSSRMVNFTSTDQIAAHADTLRAYLAEAIENEKAGRKVDFPKDDLDPPEELTDALDADPELAAAFAALTPGRRRGYILNISQAKQSATRAARVAKHAPHILEGKGMHDR